MVKKREAKPSKYGERATNQYFIKKKRQKKDWLMAWRDDVMGPGNVVEVVLGIRQCDRPVVVNRAVRRAADGLMSRGDDVTDGQEGGDCNTEEKKIEKKIERDQILKRRETERMKRDGEEMKLKLKRWRWRWSHDKMA